MPTLRAGASWVGGDQRCPPANPGQLSSDPRYFAEQERLNLNLKYVPHISAIHQDNAESPTERQFAMPPSISPFRNI